MHHPISFVSAVLYGALATTSTLADTLHVPAPYPTIQAAIDAALDGDEIVVADGTHTGPGNKNVDFLEKAITLRSESGNRDACIIDCEGNGRFATFFAGDTATVRSITIENGDPGAPGGAVLVSAGSSPSFIDCAFRACTASLGGAIRIDEGGDPTIDGCSFVGNSAGFSGGGVDARGGRISRSIFLDNVAGFAGGGAILGGTFEEVSDSLFQGNRNPGDGGGGGVVLVAGNAVLVRNVVFLQNHAQYGGGAGIHGAEIAPIFVNCLFVGNEAVSPADGGTASGGAVDTSVGNATLVNCTLSGNTSDGYGGGVSAYLTAHATLVGCVLWGNDAPNGPEIRISYPGGFEGGTATVSYSDVAGGEEGVSTGKSGTLEWGDGNIDADPLLDDQFCLSAGSPAIDAGDNTAVPENVTDDIHGRSRFVDDPDTPDTGNGTPPLVDMGACELQTCPADVDRSGAVDFGDILDVLAAWGPYEVCPPYVAADLDFDCTVAFSDVLAVLAAWGPCQ